MSDTPRTDGAEWTAHLVPADDVQVVRVEFARTLERELEASESYARGLKEALEEIAKADRVTGSGFLARLAYHQVCEIARAAFAPIICGWWTLARTAWKTTLECGLGTRQRLNARTGTRTPRRTRPSSRRGSRRIGTATSRTVPATSVGSA